MRCIYKTGGDANVCLSNRAEQFRMGQGRGNKGVTYKISAPEYDVPTKREGVEGRVTAGTGGKACTGYLMYAKRAEPQTEQRYSDAGEDRKRM